MLFRRAGAGWVDNLNVNRKNQMERREREREGTDDVVYVGRAEFCQTVMLGDPSISVFWVGRVPFFDWIDERNA